MFLHFHSLADSKKQETEMNVQRFTDICGASHQSMAETSLLRVMLLLDGMCDDVVLLPAPICPNLPVEQQRCSVGAAFSCVIRFNTDILSQGPSLIWRDWCS